MSYLLTKLLPLFVYPLGLALLFSLLALLLLSVRMKRGTVFFLLLSIGLLWTASTPRFADTIIASLEQKFPPRQAAAMPTAEAILILGGVTRGTVSGTGITDLDGGVDRLIYGAQLFQLGKAPLLVLSGGNAEGFQPEAEAMADILKIMGIPEQKMLLETKSRNTGQNAAYTLPLLQKKGIHQVLLVTSAYHMRRAAAVFKKSGLKVIPAATDYQVVERPSTLLDWLPQAASLQTTTKGIKEYIGWWVYSMQNLLNPKTL